MRYSFSKSLSIPGDRIGYLAVNPRMGDSLAVTTAARQALGMMGFVNAPATCQRVVQRCLRCGIDMEYYRRNLDFFYGNLIELGFKLQKPCGAFYLFIEAPNGDEDALMQAAEANNVVLVEGSAFGMPGYARASFCVDFPMIERSIPAWRKTTEALGILPA